MEKQRIECLVWEGDNESRFSLYFLDQDFSNFSHRKGDTRTWWKNASTNNHLGSRRLRARKHALPRHVV